MSVFSSNRQFSLALDTLSEWKSEFGVQFVEPISAFRLVPVPLTPSLATTLDEIGPMPCEALFMGIASDGLPVLLNLHVPSPGPVLVIGDSGVGKTAFLKNIARGVERMHEPEDVQYCVMTAFPEQWEGFSDAIHSAGIFPVDHPSVIDILSSLNNWAHHNKGSQQSVILLLDGLENIEKINFEAQQLLRWLLLRGPDRRVWPIVTVNAGSASQVEAWLDAFRTRVFGYVEKCHPLFEKGVDGQVFQSLKAGLQFTLREGNNWTRFWIPQ